MTQSALNELYDIKKELSSIIGELESISYGVRYDFTGIGSNLCANKIDNAIRQYRIVARLLNNIDTSKVAQQFSGGGGGW